MKLISKGAFTSILFYVNTLFYLFFSSNFPLQKPTLDLYKLYNHCYFTIAFLKSRIFSTKVKFTSLEYSNENFTFIIIIKL